MGFDHTMLWTADLTLAGVLAVEIRNGWISITGEVVFSTTIVRRMGRA